MPTESEKNPGLKPIEKFCQKQDESQTVQAQSLTLDPDPKTPLKRRAMNVIALLTFVVMWLWVGAVSAVDTALAVHYRETLKTNEQNSIARMILAADGWEVSRFVALKMMGTILVLGVLAIAYASHKKYAYVIGGVLALFQALLLFYLLAA
jgi:hypothetical protein